ncbi:MAG: complex I subunit 4 family protein, partial [Nitrosomonas sp.]
MSFEFPILSLVIWLPIVFGIAVLATGNDRNANSARVISLIGAILGFIAAIPLYSNFNSASGTMQFVEHLVWFERFNVNYHVGIDGISMPLILLNCFITPLVIVAGWEVIKDRVSQYMGAFLLMSGIVNGVFASLDAILFYVFWEASLIPMFLIIGIWGGPNRVYAAIKFFLYTLLGSLLMLIAFIYLYQTSGGSFSIQDYHQLAIPLTPQILIFVAFL